MRYSARPTFAQFDCRPYGDDSDEECEQVGGGAKLVDLAVHGVTPAMVRLEVTYD